MQFNNADEFCVEHLRPDDSAQEVCLLPTRFESYKPHLIAALRSFSLDVQYHRAQGDSVFYFGPSGDEVEVLDLVNGFGALLLGHAHPALTEEAVRFLNSGAGNLMQGSVNREASQLAVELSRRAKVDAAVVFANSGSEAVEVAIKHALLETQGDVFLALKGSFHGKTSAAVQLTFNEFYRSPFAANRLKVRWLDPTDEAELREALSGHDRLAGFFFEAIQGEGGIRPVSRAYLELAADLCRKRGIPFIADECHTGLGRTGTFLASHALDLKPDYTILSKSLGGGLAKISAVLIRRERYRSEFDVLHSSTFAGDAYSCVVASKTLELLDDATMQQCRRTGERLKAELQSLRRSFPRAVADVRGEGLLLGLELRPPADDAGFLFRFLKENCQLGLCVAGYLLKQHRIRVLPTLSDPWTLRIQPSVFLSSAAVDRIVGALRDVLQKLTTHDVTGLTSFLSQGETGPELSSAWPTSRRWVTYSPANRPARRSTGDAPRVAWLFHLVDGNDLPHLEPALETMVPADRQRYLDRLAPSLSPIVMDCVSIRSATGKRVELCPILLPFTSQRFKHYFVRRRFRGLRALIQRAIDVAAELHCGVVSLGQFTSIVTGQGRFVASRGMGLTSGNSLSAAMAIKAIRQALVARGTSATDATLAVVGAAGDIGRVCAEVLGQEFHTALLIGSTRPDSAQRLQLVAQTCGADFSCNLAEVQAADVVVTATSSVDFPLDARQLRKGAIVCDISVPQTVRPATLKKRPDVMLLRGGLVSLPCGEDLAIPGIGLDEGIVYGCLAEGLALAWEGARNTFFTGRTTAEKVRTIGAIAERHGLLPAHSTMAEVHALDAIELHESSYEPVD